MELRADKTGIGKFGKVTVDEMRGDLHGKNDSVRRTGINFVRGHRVEQIHFVFCKRIILTGNR